MTYSKNKYLIQHFESRVERKDGLSKYRTGTIWSGHSTFTHFHQIKNSKTKPTANFLLKKNIIDIIYSRIYLLLKLNRRV